MKIHLNLATTDLARSVQFYSSLLDAKPTAYEEGPRCEPSSGSSIAT